jgi:phosphoglycerate dehydrogenase-like enzyme
VRVAVLDDYQDVARHMADWGSLPEEIQVSYFHDHVADEDRLVARLDGFAIVVAMRERTPFPRSLLARLPGLRLLVTTGMRNAAIDLQAANDLGIAVTGTGGIGTHTAELTWALILSLLRHVASEDASVRAGGWQRTVGTDLAGNTLGVLGLGNIGRRVAAIGLAFGMEVIAWSQNLTADAASAVGVRRVERAELFSRADVVTIHLVLGDRTRGLVGGPELAAMKPSAYLVNTSRAPIVEESALVECLRQGRIAGAGLDVYEVEPLPADHPLRTLPNTVLTPHLGYVTQNSYRVFYTQAVEDIAAFLAGAPVRVLNGQ